MTARPSAARKSSSHPADKPDAVKKIELVPMKPRPKLFVTLLIAFVVWVGLLLAMYWTATPYRSPQEPATTQALVEA